MVIDSIDLYILRSGVGVAYDGPVCDPAQHGCEGISATPAGQEGAVPVHGYQTV